MNNMASDNSGKSKGGDGVINYDITDINKNEDPSWTSFEKLLLVQAVYKYGENWLAVTRTMKHHPLKEHPKEFFTTKACTDKFKLLIEPLQLDLEGGNEQKKKSSEYLNDAHRMSATAKLAKQLYQDHVSNLKSEIQTTEQRFRAIINEIHDIRTGKLDSKLLKKIKEQQQQQQQQVPSSASLSSSPPAQNILSVIEEQQPSPNKDAGAIIDNEKTKIDNDNNNDNHVTISASNTNSTNYINNINNNNIQKVKDNIDNIKGGDENNIINIVDNNNGDYDDNNVNDDNIESKHDLHKDVTKLLGKININDDKDMEKMEIDTNIDANNIANNNPANTNIPININNNNKDDSNDDDVQMTIELKQGEHSDKVSGSNGGDSGGDVNYGEKMDIDDNNNNGSNDDDDVDVDDDDDIYISSATITTSEQLLDNIKKASSDGDNDEKMKIDNVNIKDENKNGKVTTTSNVKKHESSSNVSDQTTVVKGKKKKNVEVEVESEEEKVNNEEEEVAQQKQGNVMTVDNNDVNSSTSTSTSLSSINEEEDIDINEDDANNNNNNDPSPKKEIVTPSQIEYNESSLVPALGLVTATPTGGVSSTPAGASTSTPGAASISTPDVIKTPHSNSSEVAPGDMFENTNDDNKKLKTWLKLVSMIFHEISNHRCASLFQNPIREQDAPGYNEIVNHPTDLKTLKRRLRDGEITNTDQFHRELMLMFMNAAIYNREDTDVYRMTTMMKDHVEDQILEFRQTEGSRGVIHEPATRRKSMASDGRSRQ